MHIVEKAPIVVVPVDVIFYIIYVYNILQNLFLKKAIHGVDFWFH